MSSHLPHAPLTSFYKSIMNSWIAFKMYVIFIEPYLIFFFCVKSIRRLFLIWIHYCEKQVKSTRANQYQCSNLSQFASICIQCVSEHLLNKTRSHHGPLASWPTVRRPLLSNNGPRLIRPYSLIVAFLFRSVYIFTPDCAGATMLHW